MLCSSSALLSASSASSRSVTASSRALADPVPRPNNSVARSASIVRSRLQLRFKMRPELRFCFGAGRVASALQDEVPSCSYGSR